MSEVQKIGNKIMDKYWQKLTIKNERLVTVGRGIWVMLQANYKLFKNAIKIWFNYVKV